MSTAPSKESLWGAGHPLPRCCHHENIQNLLLGILSASPPRASQWEQAACFGDGFHFGGGSTRVHQASLFKPKADKGGSLCGPCVGPRSYVQRGCPHHCTQDSKGRGTRTLSSMGQQAVVAVLGNWSGDTHSQTLRVDIFGEPCSLSRTSPSSIRPGATGGPFVTKASLTPDVPEERPLGSRGSSQRPLCPSHTVLCPWVWQWSARHKPPGAGDCVFFTSGVPTT